MLSRFVRCTRLSKNRSINYSTEILDERCKSFDLSVNGKNNIWIVGCFDGRKVMFTSGHNVYNPKSMRIRNDIIGDELASLEWSLPMEYVKNGNTQYDFAYHVIKDDKYNHVKTLIPRSIFNHFSLVEVITMNNMDINGNSHDFSVPMIYDASMSRTIDSYVLNGSESVCPLIYEIYNIGHRGISGSILFKNQFFVGMISRLAHPLGDKDKVAKRAIVYSWVWIKHLLTTKAFSVRSKNNKINKSTVLFSDI